MTRNTERKKRKMENRCPMLQAHRGLEDPLEQRSEAGESEEVLSQDNQEEAASVLWQERAPGEEKEGNSRENKASQV